MAKIFISYSRADRQFVDDLSPLLRKTYGYDSIWFDDEIYGGSHWWELILAEIGKCSVFIYLISNESLQSTYCLAEIQEAVRLNKGVLPVIIRPKTNLQGSIPADIKAVLDATQYVDMAKGVKDSAAIASLYGGITTLLAENPAPKPSVPSTFSNTTLPQVTDHNISHPLKVKWLITIVGVLLIITMLGVLLVFLTRNSYANPATISSVTPDLTVTPLILTNTPITMIPSTAIIPTNTALSSPTDIPTASPTTAPSYTPMPTNTAQPTVSAIKCPDALPSRLTIGDTAIYNSGSDNFRVAVRNGPAKSYDTLDIFNAAEYPEVEIIAGPVCDQEPGLGTWVWWKVRVKINGIVGWAIESTNRSYYLNIR